MHTTRARAHTRTVVRVRGRRLGGPLAGASWPRLRVFGFRVWSCVGIEKADITNSEDRSKQASLGIQQTDRTEAHRLRRSLIAPLGSLSNATPVSQPILSVSQPILSSSRSRVSGFEVRVSGLGNTEVCKLGVAGARRSLDDVIDDMPKHLRSNSTCQAQSRNMALRCLGTNSTCPNT